MRFQGLLYRDQRMRYLVTWTSPIVYRPGELESIGVYGIEGRQVLLTVFYSLLIRSLANLALLQWRYGALIRLWASIPKATDNSSGRLHSAGSRQVD